jgi:acetyl-CoA acetyltransferase
VNNPYAQFQDEYSLDDIRAARMIHDPLTKLQCSPTFDDAAAGVVASERFVEEHSLWTQHRPRGGRRRRRLRAARVSGEPIDAACRRPCECDW